MNDEPLVSVIIIFLNAERFFEEAILSVLDQTYKSFELILIDDGSDDGSTAIARRYVDLYPAQIHYFDHHNHQNLDMPASRNLGIRQARGKYIAFLDADDIWLSNKLEQQITIMEANPDVGMLYGKTKYWFSWTQRIEDTRRDFSPNLGIRSDTKIKPPHLLPLYLRGKASIPCPTSIILRKEVFIQTNGFEEQFQGINNIYEDQAFYSKVCLTSSVLIKNDCWDLYRQHPDASVALAIKLDQEIEARKFYLSWMENYLLEQEVTDPKVWQALHQEFWRLHYPHWMPKSRRIRNFVRWIKKWLLKVERALLPNALHSWLWKAKYTESS